MLRTLVLAAAIGLTVTTPAQAREHPKLLQPSIHRFAHWFGHHIDAAPRGVSKCHRRFQNVLCQMRLVDRGASNDFVCGDACDSLTITLFTWIRAQHRDDCVEVQTTRVFRSVRRIYC